MQQGIAGCAHVGGYVPPPVVDQDVEILQCLDLVPPHARYENGITGIKLCALCVFESLTEAGVLVQDPDLWRLPG